MSDERYLRNDDIGVMLKFLCECLPCWRENLAMMTPRSVEFNKMQSGGDFVVEYFRRILHDGACVTVVVILQAGILECRHTQLNSEVQN